MNLGLVADTSAALAATRSRTAKTRLLATLLESADPADVPVVVAWLSGEIPQGRLNVGWRSLAALDVPGTAPEDGQLTVAGADSAFTALAAATGPGSASARRAHLQELRSGTTESEWRFLMALLTGELRQGALGGVMADAIGVAFGQRAELVRRVHMLTGSLPRTAQLALDGQDTLRSIGLQVGRAIAPMLAGPGSSPQQVVDTIGPDVAVDLKLDGARIQAHRDHDRVTLFTRSLRDITAQLPEVARVISELDCTTAIFDGEVVALDTGGRPLPFQDTMSEAARGDLRPFLFDCLHLDGTDLIDMPLRDRLTALRTVAPHLAIGSRTLTAATCDAAAVQGQLDAALAAGHEGVVAKSLDAPYEAGRRGKAWQKIKPVHTVDLVVLAAEWGSGRRTGTLSNLQLGAASPDGGEPVMVGKTFKGLTDELLAWQTEEFPHHETHRDRHTVHLRPELVVEIAFDGVQRSSRYPGGVALRFARVVRYRPDKTPADADTIDTLRAMLRG